MIGWVRCVDEVPETPFKHELWDADEDRGRLSNNSRIHRVAWWNAKKGKWVQAQGVFTAGWCTGWHRAGDLTTIHPDIWLRIPPLPDSSEVTE